MTTHSTTISLSDLVDRGDVALAAWAIDWLGDSIDLAAEWEALDDDGRDWLVEAGIVEAIEPTVECTDASTWDSDWRTESDAAWPGYELTITAPGLELEIGGWHLVGPMGPDGSRSSREWDQQDDDGAACGLPRVDGWELEAGANMSGGCLIPCWRHEGRLLTLDPSVLGNRLRDAAGDADHGGEPEWDDVDRADMEQGDGYYMVRDGKIVDVATLHGGLAGATTYDADDRRPAVQTTYWAEAWSHDLTDDTYQTMEDALDSLRELADDGKIYRHHRSALKALSELAVDAQGEDVADGLVAGIEDDGRLYVADENDPEDRYHLDADDTADVLAHGWAGVVDQIRSAFGTRKVLGLARDWQAEMDAAIITADPWVMVADSLAAGNCKQETAAFAARLQEGADGEIGAVRASVILALRDDPYTRRACRLAAWRYLKGR